MYESDVQADPVDISACSFNASRTGYRIEKIDNTRGEYDDKVWQNQEEKRKVQSMVGRYKKQAMKHLDSVCVGNF